jgi:hypothetical protein
MIELSLIKYFVFQLKIIIIPLGRHLRFYVIKISQQPENCENRNDPDLVQAFLKKWWVETHT